MLKYLSIESATFAQTDFCTKRLAEQKINKSTLKLVWAQKAYVCLHLVAAINSVYWYGPVKAICAISK